MLIALRNDSRDSNKDLEKLVSVKLSFSTFLETICRLDSLSKTFTHSALRQKVQAQELPFLDENLEIFNCNGRVGMGLACIVEENCIQLVEERWEHSFDLCILFAEVFLNLAHR